MKKLFIFYLLFFCVIDVFSDENKLIKTLTRVDFLKAQFSQSTQIAGVGKDEYTGNLYVLKGEKILWDYNRPHRQFYLFTKDDLTYYDSLTNQLIKQKAENLGVESIVLSILMEPSNINNTFFIVVLDENTYKLYPKENLGLQYIQIHLKDKFIDEILSKDENGNTTIINLSNLEINKPFDLSVFNVKIPEGAEIFNY
jgi:outer membrane lipoprotein carrier protein